MYAGYLLDGEKVVIDGTATLWVPNSRKSLIFLYH